MHAPAMTSVSQWAARYVRLKAISAAKTDLMDTFTVERLPNLADIPREFTDALSSKGTVFDYGVAGIGLSAVFSQRVQLYLYYEALLGVSDLASSSLALGIRGQF